MGPSSALLLAVRDDVRALLIDTGKLCDVRPDGQPTPSAGEWYYAVHSGGFRGFTDQATHIETLHEVYMTITRRAGFAPQDRIGVAILTESGSDPSLMDRADQFAEYLHGRGLTLVAANGRMPATNLIGFCEPLRFRCCTQPELRGPNWFFCESESKPKSGYSVTLTFDSARYSRDLR